jgi:hypothetical protein
MKILIIVLLLFGESFEVFASDKLQTLAEKSQWIKTGNGKETERLCHAFHKQYPNEVQCRTYGTTPENRKLHYLVVGNPKSPAVWVQAGIHAGEIDGKDAVFYLLRQILEKKINNPLKGIHLVFIPIVNLDGHERIGKWNRPNQIGPEEMGWRTTAQNYNLNRDFMKVDAPEMQSLVKLWHKVSPVLSLDLHVTDGAQFQPEVGLIILPNSFHGVSPLHEAGKKFEMALLEKMKSRKHLALPFYPTFEENDNPLSGFSRYVALGRFAHGYWQNNNRLAMLVETHSWKNYATRVKTHYDTVLSSLEIAQAEAKTWQLAGRSLDGQTLKGKVVLEYQHTSKSVPLDFPGYKFTLDKSEISGGKVIRYDSNAPETWRVPYYEEQEPLLTVDAPNEGYFIQPADSKLLLPKLHIHGIKYSQYNNDRHQTLKIFRATKTELSASSFEGHQTLKVKGEWKEEETILPKGSIFVPIKQAKGRLILHLLEPEAQDSFLSWGFLNRAFEQKEYMENYVTEVVAKDMLRSPKIRTEFQNKIKSDPEFAKSPAKRFEFFYRKHPSWDDRFNRYPVFKR